MHLRPEGNNLVTGVCLNTGTCPRGRCSARRRRDFMAEVRTRKMPALGVKPGLSGLCRSRADAIHISRLPSLKTLPSGHIVCCFGTSLFSETSIKLSRISLCQSSSGKSLLPAKTSSSISKEKFKISKQQL